MDGRGAGVAAAVTRAGVRVLVVEPAAVPRLLAIRLLERLGCDVDAISSGQEAVDLAASGEYRLLLVSADTDDLDAAMVALAVRATGASAAIAVLAEEVSPADEARWEAAGIMARVARPVGREDLQGLVARLAGRRNPSAPAAAAFPVPPAGLAGREMLSTQFRDDQPFYAEMLELFVQTAREPITRMREAVASAQWDEARQRRALRHGRRPERGRQARRRQAGAVEDWARSTPRTAGEMHLPSRLAALERALDEVSAFAGELASWARAGGLASKAGDL